MEKKVQRSFFEGDPAKDRYPKSVMCCLPSEASILLAYVDVDHRTADKEEKNDAFLAEVERSGDLEEPQVVSKPSRVQKVKQSKRKVNNISL